MSANDINICHTSLFISSTVNLHINRKWRRNECEPLRPELDPARSMSGCNKNGKTRLCTYLLYIYVYIDFISRGNILNNIANMPITIATKKHKKLLKVKKSDPISGVLTKTSISTV